MRGPTGLGGLVATRASPAGPFCMAIAKGDGLTLWGVSRALSAWWDQAWARWQRQAGTRADGC